MSNEHSEIGEGHSPAAWTSVTVMLVGFAIGTVALFLDGYAIVWASAAIIVVGALLWPVMSKMGYGANGPRYVPKSHAE